MKKVSILFVSALTLGTVFTSCNKDDDNANSSGSLEGKWVYAKEGMIMNGQEILTDHENECSTKMDYMELKTGGTLDEVYYPSDCTADVTSGTWAKNGNNIAVSIDGEQLNAEIVSLTAANLKVKMTISTPDGDMTAVTVFNRG